MPRLLPAQRILVASTLANTVGNGCFASAIVVYLSLYRGFSIEEVAWILTISSFFGMAAQWPAGALSDRIQPRLLISIGNFVAFCLAIVTAMATDFFTVGCTLCLFRFVDRGANIARVSMIPKLYAGVAAVEFRNVTRATSFGGLAVGGLTAGLFMAVSGAGPAICLVANGLLYIPMVVLARWLPDVSQPGRSGEATVNLRKSAIWHDHGFMQMIGAIGISGIATGVLSFVVPIFLVTQLNGPAWLPSILVTVSTATSVGLQVPLGRVAKTIDGSTRALVLGSMLCCTGLIPLLFASAGMSELGFGIICVTAALITGTGVVLWNAGQFGLVMPLANPARQGEYQGVVGSVESGIDAITPWVVVQAFAFAAPGWLVLFALIAAGAGFVPVTVRRQRALAEYLRSEP